MKIFIKELKQWLKSLIIAVAVVLIINVFFASMTVYGVSMNPILDDQDVLILQKKADYNRGDIISFNSDIALSEDDIQDLNPIQRLYTVFNPNMKLIKRVIGLPGDSVLIENGEVYVNGVKLVEKYIGSYTTGSVYIEQIPANEYFIMGDNRSNSVDSRSESVGTIKADQIIGEVLVRIFPLNKIGRLDP